MDSFKTATALAEKATLYEQVDDLRFEVHFSDTRIIRIQNDLRKKLRAMRKRAPPCQKMMDVHISSAERTVSIILKNQKGDQERLKTLEARLAEAMRKYTLPYDPNMTDSDSDLEIITEPNNNKRRRLRYTPNTAAVLYREDVFSVIVSFLNTKDAMLRLAATSREFKTLTKRWVPRLGCTGSRVPPPSWHAHELKGLSSIRCMFSNDLPFLSTKLVNLAVDMIIEPIDTFNAMNWPRLETLRLKNTSPSMFWSSFSPDKMPHLRRVDLAWCRSTAPHAWIHTVRTHVDSGKLRLTWFPSDIKVEGPFVEDYLAIHRAIGTTSFHVWMNLNATMFRDTVGANVQHLVIHEHPFIPPPRMEWVLTDLPKIKTLDIQGGWFAIVEADTPVNTTITNITIRDTHSDAHGMVNSLLRKIGPQLVSMNITMWSLRQLTLGWPTLNMQWADSLETLTLRSSGRYLYSVPHTILTSLRRLTLHNLSDTQAYCAIADAASVGRTRPNHGFVLRIPTFVTNKVASILFTYEKDSRCRTPIEIAGFQSDFFLAIGGDRLRKTQIINPCC